MALELLNNPYSTCSQKVRLTLHEKGLPFTDTRLDFRKKEHLSPEYLKLNPNGVVPTLLDDGRPVVDSSVIMEYLEERFPEMPLAPADAYGRAQMRAWLRFLEEVPTTAIRVPSFNRVFVRHSRDLSEEDRAENAEIRPLRKHFYQKMGRDGFDDTEHQASLDRLRQTVERMEGALQKHDWLVGDALTLADFCVVPTIDRMEDLGLADTWSDLPGVTRWWTAIQKRPAFTATYASGARLSDIYEDLQRPA
ncbi:glutathione S-transferase family protein [Rhodobacteraceae bacterium M385]|nr:glutathione S-transferase family protein [Rhodobacteraceae bacterium M385]